MLTSRYMIVNVKQQQQEQRQQQCNQKVRNGMKMYGKKRKRDEPADECGLLGLPSDVVCVLWQAVRRVAADTSNGDDRVARYCWLQGMHKLLHAAVSFEVFLNTYAQGVRELDGLYPAQRWNQGYYDDESKYSPVLIRTVIRSGGTQLKAVRLPFYGNGVGGEMILPTLFDECKSIERIGFDDGGRVDSEVMGKLALSRLKEVSVNRAGEHVVQAMRIGLSNVRNVRLLQVERLEVVRVLLDAVRDGALQVVREFEIEFSGGCGKLVCDASGGGSDAHGDEGTLWAAELLEEVETKMPQAQRVAVGLVRWTEAEAGETVDEMPLRKMAEVDALVAGLQRAGGGSGGRATALRQVHVWGRDGRQVRKVECGLRAAVATGAEVELTAGGFAMLVRDGARRWTRLRLGGAQLSRLFVGGAARARSAVTHVQSLQLHLADEVLLRQRRAVDALLRQCRPGLVALTLRGCGGAELLDEACGVRELTLCACALVGVSVPSLPALFQVVVTPCAAACSRFATAAAVVVESVAMAAPRLRRFTVCRGGEVEVDVEKTMASLEALRDLRHRRPALCVDGVERALRHWLLLAQRGIQHENVAISCKKRR